jgi:pimeloyl-ACP methyl ester carboxylesterase
LRVFVNGIRLFVEIFGQEWADNGQGFERRPVLVGLHGGPGIDGTALRHSLAPLADVSQLIVPDQRGHGRSDAGEPSSWNLANWADDVASLCDALDIERPIVLGISFGGFVAQQYASSYPDQIAALILLSTGPRFPAADELIARVRELGGDEAAEAMRRDIENSTEETAAEVRRLCAPLYSRRAAPDPAFAELEPHMIKTPEVTTHWFPEAQKKLDLRERLSAVRCRTLVLVGEHDPLNPRALASETAAAIPGGLARLEIVPDAAHRVLTDNPEHVLRSVREFLAELR